MNSLLSNIDRSSRLAETLAVVLIFAYCGLMLAEVFARSQAQSFSFSWEYSQYAMAAIFALASGPAIRTGVHVRIGLFTEILPARFSKWLDVSANIVALLIAAAMAWAMWVKVGKSLDRNILATTVTQTALWIPQTFVLLGLIQLWLDLFARLIRRIVDQKYEWRGADAETSDA